MKKTLLIFLAISLFGFSASFSFSASAKECKKICEPRYLDSGFIVLKKDIQTAFNGHFVTYRGLYNGGPAYQINFDNNRSTLTISKTKKVESIVDSLPPLFIDFDVESYNDNEIKLRFTRFETPKCYNPNIKLSW